MVHQKTKIDYLGGWEGLCYHNVLYSLYAYFTIEVTRSHNGVWGYGLEPGVKRSVVRILSCRDYYFTFCILYDTNRLDLKKTRKFSSLTNMKGFYIVDKRKKTNWIFLFSVYELTGSRADPYCWGFYCCGLLPSWLLQPLVKYTHMQRKYWHNMRIILTSHFQR